MARKAFLSKFDWKFIGKTSAQRLEHIAPFLFFHCSEGRRSGWIVKAWSKIVLQSDLLHYKQLLAYLKLKRLKTDF